MIRIAVIDDENVFTEKVKNLIGDYFKPLQMEYEVRSYTKPVELVWDLNANQYFDLYFMDIEMPYVNGMDLAQKIRLKYDEPYIIFVTSYTRYCIRGYKYNAWRYILKSNLDKTLPEALDSLLERLRTKEEKLYVIEYYNKVSKISYNDIYYAYVKDKYTYFKTDPKYMVSEEQEQQDDKDGELKKDFRVRKTLSQVYEELSAKSKEFLLVDKGFLVNLRHILEVDDHCLVMRDEKKIAVSVRQYSKVMKSISSYWRGEL